MTSVKANKFAVKKGSPTDWPVGIPLMITNNRQKSIANISVVRKNRTVALHTRDSPGWQGHIPGNL